MERWPSLWQDQGITLNPPDRCHMHARAHKCTGKRKWWQGGGGGKKEADINLEKKKKHATETPTCKAQGGACVVSTAKRQTRHASIRMMHVVETPQSHWVLTPECESQYDSPFILNGVTQPSTHSIKDYRLRVDSALCRPIEHAQ